MNNGHASRENQDGTPPPERYNETLPPEDGNPAFSIDALSLIEALLTRWHWVAAAAVLLGLLAVPVALTIWNTSYTSTAQIIHYEPSVAAGTLQPMEMETIVSMIQSPELLQKVGAQLDPPLTAQKLSRRLTVTPDRNHGIATITVTGSSLQESVDTANLFCAEAVRMTQDLQRKEAREALSYMSQQVAASDADLESERRKTQLRSAPSVPLSSLVAQKVRKAREELSDLLLRYTEAHPLVLQQQAKLDALNDELARASNSNVTTVSTGEESPVPAASESAGSGRPASADSDGVKSRLRELEADHLLLVNRDRAIQMLAENPPGQLRVLASAAARDVKTEQHRLKMLLFLLFCSVLGAAGMAAAIIIRELLDRRLKNATDVHRVTGLPLLASVRNLDRLSSEDRENWAFRTWTALQHRLLPSPDHGIVCGVMSAENGEGRSAWIHLLAQAASQRGFRVLTISTRPTGPQDAALEDIDGAEKEGIDIESVPCGSLGLANVLTAPAQVTEQLLGPDPQPIVHIPLPGWVWNHERRRQWQEALKAWNKIGNIAILIELPPASMPESVLLAENLPNLIWLVNGGTSEAETTRTQLETLRHARCNLVGAVLNQAPASPVRNVFSRWIGCAAMALALLAVPSGAAGQVPEPEDETPPAAASPALFSAMEPRQRAGWQERLTLGPDDLLNFDVFGQPELSQKQVPIGPDGRISFLEARNVMASGLTVDEFREHLTEELAKYRRGTQVLVFPAAYRSKKYFVLGKVQQQGVFTLNRPVTIIEAVARARGFEVGLTNRKKAEMADFSRSFLARGGRHLPVNLEKLFLEGDLSQNVALEPGDYLYFPAANLKEVYVLGDVRQPGAAALDPSAGVLAAIAERGGFTERAWRERVLVVRGSLNKPETFVVNANAMLGAKQAGFDLKPGDIVYVNYRPWIKAEELLDALASAFVQSAIVTLTGTHAYPIISY
jgi:protein involved in polysaccharide export with SLBB domain/capsular polysaccharide biosynthesis protein